MNMLHDGITIACFFLRLSQLFLLNEKMDSGIASFCCSLFVSAALLRYYSHTIQSTPYTIQFSYFSYVQSCASVTLLSFLNICISPGRKRASLSCQSVCFKKKRPHPETMQHITISQAIRRDIP